MQKKQTRKGRNVWVLWLALFLMTGCANNAPAEEVSAEPEVMESTPAPAESGTGTEDTDSDSVSEVMEGNEIRLPEAPEGYVYDYQVSDEPIPVEIAELGGPVQGTIHAYPSLILKELTRLELENDPERKQEAEEYGEEIKAYLLERYGAECEVEIMSSDSDFFWDYWCKEIDTEYIFFMRYCPSLSEDYRVHDGYIYFLSDQIHPQINDIVKNIWGDTFVLKTFFQPNRTKTAEDIEDMENYSVSLYMSVFTEGIINKLEEQNKILNFWNDIKFLRERGDITVSIRYYDIEYKNVINEKFYSSYIYDYSLDSSYEKLLVEAGVMKENFNYSSVSEESSIDAPEVNLTTLLEDYFNDIPITEEWNYWN